MLGLPERSFLWKSPAGPPYSFFSICPSAARSICSAGAYPHALAFFTKAFPVLSKWASKISKLDIVSFFPEANKSLSKESCVLSNFGVLVCLPVWPHSGCLSLRKGDYYHTHWAGNRFADRFKSLNKINSRKGKTVCKMASCGREAAVGVSVGISFRPTACLLV